MLPNFIVKAFNSVAKYIKFIKLASENAKVHVEEIEIYSVLDEQSAGCSDKCTTHKKEILRELFKIKERKDHESVVLLLNLMVMLAFTFAAIGSYKAFWKWFHSTE